MNRRAMREKNSLAGDMAAMLCTAKLAVVWRSTYGVTTATRISKVNIDLDLIGNHGELLEAE